MPSHPPSPPEGTYEFVVEHVESGLTKKSSKTMWKARSRIVAGPWADTVLAHTFIITEDNPAALGVFFRSMDALGLDRAFFSMNPTVDDVSAALMGRKFRGVVKHNEWNGKSYAQIERYHQVPGTVAVEIDLLDLDDDALEAGSLRVREA